MLLQAIVVAMPLLRNEQTFEGGNAGDETRTSRKTHGRTIREPVLTHWSVKSLSEDGGGFEI